MESIEQQIVRQRLTIIKQLVTKDRNGNKFILAKGGAKGMKHYCPYCNSEQEYYIDKRIFKEYKGIDVNVEENVPICKKCKNELKTFPNIFNGFKVLDLEKLQNLISYIASKTKLYLTSLNKYLWFIDMISYNERAVSITGLSYIHEQYGPVIVKRKYEEISKLDEKYKREDKEQDDGSIQSIITSNGNYDLSSFSDKEMKIIDYVINLLSNKSVKEISNLSHKELGWKNTERFEKISFEYANELQILK